MNMFFDKKPNRKWTWRSPDGRTKNEIDFILTPHKYQVQDISVINQLPYNSDHRLVRAKIKLPTRAKLLHIHEQKRSNYNITWLRSENEMAQKYVSTLKTKLDDFPT